MLSLTTTLPAAHRRHNPQRHVKARKPTANCGIFRHIHKCHTTTSLVLVLKALHGDHEAAGKTNTPHETTPSTIRSTLLSLFTPALLSLVLEPLYSATDTAILGRVSATALAGVALSTYRCVGCGRWSTWARTHHHPLHAYSFGVVSFLFTALTVITTSTVAAAVAANNITQAQDAVIETAVFAACAGVVAGVVLYMGVPNIVAAMGATGQVAAASIAYSRTRAWGMWAGLTFFVVTGALRGVKDTKTTAILSAVGVFVNAVLDYVLVLGLGWGARGAATATVTVQVAQVVVGLALLKQRGLLVVGGGEGKTHRRWHTVCGGFLWSCKYIITDSIHNSCGPR